MPGSRKGEITKLMPIYRELVSKINSKAILIIPQHFTSKYIKEVYGDISNFTNEFVANKLNDKFKS
mgnify:CR=1 FL=1